MVREMHSSAPPGLTHQAELLVLTVSRDRFVRETYNAAVLLVTGFEGRGWEAMQ